KGNEGRIYELVVRHFLACLSADARGAETTIRLVLGTKSPSASTISPISLSSPHLIPTIPSGLNGRENCNPDSGGEMFTAHGLVVLEANYLEVYIYESWTERFMPNFTQYEEVTPTSIEATPLNLMYSAFFQMVTSETRPPPLLTEADLIALMDKHGIGTDATHAEHIETIKQRLYAGLQGDKFIIPGQLGMGLVEAVISSFMIESDDILTRD
ncbi:unnamed protein product, partial [Protopolystoma xenopodis]